MRSHFQILFGFRGILYPASTGPIPTTLPWLAASELIRPPSWKKKKGGGSSGLAGRNQELSTLGFEEAQSDTASCEAGNLETRKSKKIFIECLGTKGSFAGENERKKLTFAFYSPIIKNELRTMR
jgi:hypothetical protein